MMSSTIAWCFPNHHTPKSDFLKIRNASINRHKTLHYWLRFLIMRLKRLQSIHRWNLKNELLLLWSFLAWRPCIYSFALWERQTFSGNNSSLIHLTTNKDFGLTMSGITCSIERFDYGRTGLSRLGGGKQSLFFSRYFSTTQAYRCDASVGDRKDSYFGE